MIMQEVREHVCVEVCSSLSLTSGIILNIIFDQPCHGGVIRRKRHAAKRLPSFCVMTHTAMKILTIMEVGGALLTTSAGFRSMTFAIV